MPRGGRRSKGDRHSFTCRMPRELADFVMEQADETGMTYSDWIAAQLAAKHGLDISLAPPAKTTDPTSVQGELPMKTAS